MRSGQIVLAAVSTAVVWMTGMPAAAQDAFEQAPINYSASEADDVVSRLQTRIEKGEAALEHDEAHGYLKGLLRELNIPISSQVLVFSKTSFQPSRISPRTPRAIYFGDEAYVGWVQHSNTLEVSLADAELGTNFYTLSRERDRPQFVRQTD